VLQWHSARQSLVITLVEHFSQKWLFQKGHDLIGIVLRLGIDRRFEIFVNLDGRLEYSHMPFTALYLNICRLAKEALVLLIVVLQCLHHLGKWIVELLVDIELRVLERRRFLLRRFPTLRHTEVVWEGRTCCFCLDGEIRDRSYFLCRLSLLLLNCLRGGWHPVRQFRPFVWCILSFLFYCWHCWGACGQCEVVACWLLLLLACWATCNWTRSLLAPRLSTTSFDSFIKLLGWLWTLNNLATLGCLTPSSVIRRERLILG